MDFTLNTYKQLLITLKEQGYRFVSFEQYCGMTEEEKQCEEKYIIMRHDVDKYPQNSLAVAKTFTIVWCTPDKTTIRTCPTPSSRN